MTTQDFILLRDFILQKNPYLNKGYANAFKDSVNHIPMCRVESGDLMIVFPQDTQGNYFYLRNQEGIQHTPATSVMDSGTGRVSFLDVINVNIVVVMRDADIYKLSNNMINTAMMFAPSIGVSALPMSTNWNREQVIISEMAGCDEGDIATALKNLTNQTILRMVVQFKKPYTPSNCIVDPCKEC